MSASGEDRISKFERHCGLLLRAYPAAYRSERGAEIIGTLLETTPEGREWPLLRDIRGLVGGGLSARAALSRLNTTAANLRVAVLVGVAAYLGFAVAGQLGGFAAGYGDTNFFRWVSPVPFGPFIPHGQAAPGGAGRHEAFYLSIGVVPVLVVVTLVLAWMSRRRVTVLAAALPAVAAIAVANHLGPAAAAGSQVTEVACLAVLTAVAGQERPDGRWLWLIGPVVLAGLLIVGVLPASGLPAAFGILFLCLLLTPAIISFALVAIDARPAIATVVFLLGIWLSASVGPLVGAAGFLADLAFVGICAAVTAAAFWRLRWQSAHPGRTAVR